MLGVAATALRFTLGSFGSECRPGGMSLNPGISPLNHLLDQCVQAYLTAAKAICVGNLAIVSQDGSPILRQLRCTLLVMKQRLHTRSRMKRAK